MSDMIQKFNFASECLFYYPESHNIIRLNLVDQLLIIVETIC